MIVPVKHVENSYKIWATYNIKNLKKIFFLINFKTFKKKNLQ